MAVESGSGPSQLTTNRYIVYNGISYTVEEFIELIQNGNKYKFDTKYHDNLSPDSPLEFKKDFALSALSAIPQYNALGISNSLLARGIDALGGGFTSLSPLEQIGSAMLGKQMFYNSVAHLSQKSIPQIDIVGSIFDGEKLFNFPVNYSITNLASQNWVNRIVSTAFYSTNVVGDANPFINNEPKDFNVNNKDNNTQSFYIENTGKGQLQRFYKSINLNLYKSVSNSDGDEGNTQDELTLIKYSEIKGVEVSLEYQDIVIQRKTFFNFNNRTSHPYLLGVNKYFTENSVEDGNKNMSISYGITLEQQYAPTVDYVNTYFGVTDITETTIVRDDYIKNKDVDDVNSKLVWGRDGTTTISGTKANLIKLRDDISNQLIDENEITTSNLQSNFNINKGLLEYTRNLLNASSGFLVDITRKVYRDIDTNGNNKIVGFNGSPVWEKSSKYNNTYANANFPDTDKGIRQHNAVDKYDRYVKAIRFDGNSVYNKEGGNKDSVIYDSVLPKIHPVRKKGDVDNKNMMFSIENLAVLAIKNPEKNIGIIDDEYSTQIPISEVGPFNGRVMWFPPYDLQLNESAAAKFDSTVMVGRNEPIYTYMNSERSANLSFTLLIDHPQHLINYLGEEDYKKEIAKFFTFGGDNLPNEINTSKIEETIKQKELKLQELTNTSIPNQETPDTLETVDISFYFANAEPRVGNESNVFQYMYEKGYEVIKGLDSSIDGKGSEGLNEDIYYKAGLIQNDPPTTYSLTVPLGFSQYTATGSTNPDGTECKLNKVLYEFYNNTSNRDYYSVDIEASTSSLGSSDYNQKLSERRIAAVKNLIKERLKSMFPNDNNFVDKIFRNEQAKGEEGASPSGSTSAGINLPEVKRNRSTKITIVHNDKSIPTTEDITNYQEQIATLQNEIDNLYNKLNSERNKINNVFEERTKDSKAIFDTFESIKTNHYQPAYHSQTPEDFHRRLTFLQQCTRQGSTKRFGYVEENGVLRAKNSVFGRQPICILRVGDFFYTKVIIENLTIDYNDTTWDMNPEGFGMQPMIARITLQMKVLGGQSLAGPIDALQNASTFSYYGNSNYSNTGTYSTPSKVAENQKMYMGGVDGTGILAERIKSFKTEKGID